MQQAYNNAMQQYGTGSDLQKAAQAITGAMTALAGNNLAGALTESEKWQGEKSRSDSS